MDQHTISDRDLREYYDGIYHRHAKQDDSLAAHLRGLASRLHMGKVRVLDVACGTGQWLFALQAQGASPFGVDLSERALRVAKSTMPTGEFSVASAEALPFGERQFDMISCLGAIEHFIDPACALKEMLRVAKSDARFLLLVPNADFPPRHLGLYGGTEQTALREEVRTLDEWNALFEEAGLRVDRRWRDLHVLSWSWISARSWFLVPLRLAQALALAVWPLSWQYQVYHLCSKATVEGQDAYS